MIDIDRVHIRFFSNGRLWFRSYSGSLLANARKPAQPKVTKRSSPHHSAPRLGSVCPHSGLNPWAAVMGHPWPRTANPASCRVAHGFKPAFGQRGRRGALDQKQERGGLRADRCLSVGLGAGGSWLACDGINRVCLMDRGVCIAGKPAPTEKQSGGVHRIRFGFAFAFAFDLDFDLRRPVKHAGRNSALYSGGACS